MFDKLKVTSPWKRHAAMQTSRLPYQLLPRQVLDRSKVGIAEVDRAHKERVTLVFEAAQINGLSISGYEVEGFDETGMRIYLLVLIAGGLLETSGFAKVSCLPPNNADQQLYFTECRLTERARTLTIDSVLPKNENGTIGYPLDFRKHMLIFEVTGRNSGTEVSTLLMDLELQQFIGLKPTSCKWFSIPVAAFLRNIDAGLEAPIHSGDAVLQIKLTLDSSHPFLLIFSSGVEETVSADGSIILSLFLELLRNECKT
ncbi:hypothetical protein TTRE_0000371301 [Trichuris trichiura]|uniref:Uncharacterized protein n=1 Tax=Trichuris trichiura TaxID=36087 RepID=A0A077Z5M2_TRITR|nr:hypothetical protein TTRE_0000371301 [Trichuris trichiura]